MILVGRTGAGSHGRSRWHLALACLLLSVLVAQLAAAILSNSATFDEPNHITRGAAILTTGDWRLSVGHPPLSNLLSALPVVLLGAPALPSNPQAWEDEAVTPLAHEWFWRVAPDPQRLVVRGRLAAAAVSVLLAALVWTWASRLYGPNAGLVALAACVLEPNLVAHGALATSDMALTAFAALAFYRLWRLSLQPGTRNVALCGVTLGLMQLTKFSAVLLVVPYAVLLVAACARTAWLAPGIAASRWSVALRRAAGRGAGVAAVAALTIWAGYGFKWDLALRPGVAHPLVERVVSDAEIRARLVPILERTPVPARQYLTGLRALVTHQSEGHPSFLLGASSPHGWWYYFLVAMALKTPIPLLALVGWAAMLTWRPRWREEMFVIVPALFVVVSTFGANINIGLRHVLPAYPLLVIFASRVAARTGTGRIERAPLAVLGTLLGWLAWEAVIVYGQPLAYFNQLAGGPSGGYRYLVDSNVDWGQDLLRLRAEMQRRGIERVKLSYFGSALPERYGIRYDPLPGVSGATYLDLVPPEEAVAACRPTTGWIAVSVTCLQNLDGYRSGLSLDWLRHHRPVGRAGHSILLYFIEAPLTGGCAAPLTPLVVSDTLHTPRELAAAAPESSIAAYLLPPAAQKSR